MDTYIGVATRVTPLFVIWSLAFKTNPAKKITYREKNSNMHCVLRQVAIVFAPIYLNVLYT